MVPARSVSVRAGLVTGRPQCWVTSRSVRRDACTITPGRRRLLRAVTSIGPL